MPAKAMGQASLAHSILSYIVFPEKTKFAELLSSSLGEVRVKFDKSISSANS